MTTNLDDLRRAIYKIRAMPRPEKYMVLTGSFGAFVRSMERRYGPMVRDDRKPITVAQFMGLDVAQDTRLPPNRAVLKKGEEVVAIIGLD